jgi:hypothetical protein
MSLKIQRKSVAGVPHFSVVGPGDELIDSSFEAGPMLDLFERLAEERQERNLYFWDEPLCTYGTIHHRDLGHVRRRFTTPVVKE